MDAFPNSSFRLNCLGLLCHHLNWLQIWTPGCVTCIVTLPCIALLALSVSIELVSSSARVTSVKFHKRLSVSLLERTGPIDRTPGTPGSDKNINIWIFPVVLRNIAKHCEFNKKHFHKKTCFATFVLISSPLFRSLPHSFVYIFSTFYLFTFFPIFIHFCLFPIISPHLSPFEL